MGIAFRSWLLSVVALGASSVSLAQNAQSADPQRAIVERADEVARANQEDLITDPTVFVKSAALGALTEIELAQLAESKSRQAGIRTFATRMRENHNAIRAELTAIARRKKLDVPTALVYEDEQLIEQGKDLNGTDFDAWYGRQMIAENDKSIALFRGAANMEDKELAAFAKKTLPTLEAQRKLAMDLGSAPTP